MSNWPNSKVLSLQYANQLEPCGSKHSENVTTVVEHIAQKMLQIHLCNVDGHVIPYAAIPTNSGKSGLTITALQTSLQRLKTVCPMVQIIGTICDNGFENASLVKTVKQMADPNLWFELSDFVHLVKNLRK